MLIMKNLKDCREQLQKKEHGLYFNVPTNQAAYWNWHGIFDLRDWVPVRFMNGPHEPATLVG